MYRKFLNEIFRILSFLVLDLCTVIYTGRHLCFTRFCTPVFFLHDFNLCIWAPYSYAEVFLNKVSISRRYSHAWKTQPIHWHRWFGLSCVSDTAESDSVDSLTPLSRTQPIHWRRWARLSCVIDTAESDSADSLTPLSRTQPIHWHRWVGLSCRPYCCYFHFLL